MVARPGNPPWVAKANSRLAPENSCNKCARYVLLKVRGDQLGSHQSYLSFSPSLLKQSSNLPSPCPEGRRNSFARR